MIAIVDVNGNSIFSNDDYARVSPYDPTKVNLLEDTNQEQITPGGIAEDKGNSVFRILDLLSLGFIERMIQFLDATFFGFINFLSALVGRFLTNDMRVLLFGASGLLKAVMMAGYVLAAFELWTGRQVAD